MCLRRRLLNLHLKDGGGKKKASLVKTDKKSIPDKGNNKCKGPEQEQTWWLLRTKRRPLWPEGIKQDCSQINLLSCMSPLSGSKDLKELHCLQHMPQTPSPALETFHY